jgi:ABC-type spermidine/putrescine transport system permease subunit I
MVSPIARTYAWIVLLGRNGLVNSLLVSSGSVQEPVPLLYTAERPRLVNDTLAEAHIYLNCRPGNLYRINLRNGQPIYVGLE